MKKLLLFILLVCATVQAYSQEYPKVVLSGDYPDPSVMRDGEDYYICLLYTSSALQQKNSFLLNKLNEKIASDRLTLTDEPHLVKASGARYFDNEGIATERRSIFDKGVLNTYFIDTYNAKKMGVDPTISGSSILVMETGDKNLDGLIAGVEKGILVTGFNLSLIHIFPCILSASSPLLRNL